MTNKSKDNHFRISGKMIFRWLVFLTVIYFAFNYLSKSEKSVLGESTLPTPQIDVSSILPVLIEKLPPQSQEIINNFEEQPIVKTVNEQIGTLTKNLNNFPESQIKEIEKYLINYLHDKLIQSVEGN